MELELLHPDMKRMGGEDILAIDADVVRSVGGRDHVDDEAPAASTAMRLIRDELLFNVHTPSHTHTHTHTVCV